MKDLLKLFADNTDNIKKTIEDRLPNQSSFDLQTILNYAYGFASLVAIGIIIYAGITYTTSQGDPGKTKKALYTIIFAAIGLVVVALAAVITNFIISTTIGAKK